MRMFFVFATAALMAVVFAGCEDYAASGGPGSTGGSGSSSFTQTPPGSAAAARQAGKAEGTADDKFAQAENEAYAEAARAAGIAPPAVALPPTAVVPPASSYVPTAPPASIRVNTTTQQLPTGYGYFSEAELGAGPLAQ